MNVCGQKVFNVVFNKCLHPSFKNMQSISSTVLMEEFVKFAHNVIISYD